ncbi:isochorismate synthase [Weissella minor]|uniref:isochorismate synthase n=1 Tax=Weissella minor TaxID=1620 RepID=UPI001BB091FF|nr:isochorismate synthase [Weissella minor]MBS0949398.1 isochorismate synthase [Weissella minor]
MQKWMNEFNQQADAVYFASADKKTRLVGFGRQSELMDWENPDMLNQWVAAQSGPIFGGFNFNPKQTLDGIMGGYFVAPKTVIDLTQNTEWQSEVERTNVLRQLVQMRQEDDWVTRMTPVLATLQNDPTKEKVVLGMQTHLALDGLLALDAILDDLEQQQPHSYHMVIKREQEVFVSATPERIVRMQGAQFETAAVAGSIRRGVTEAEDAVLADDLWRDKKNRHEHDIVVQTIVERLQDMHDLTYAAVPEILKTPQIQHLYTPITGRLDATMTVLDLVQRLHPTPALGGMPQAWAQAVIAEDEAEPRGLFAAPIGYQYPDGSGEFVVGIRSMYANAKALTLFAGAGILPDSDLAQESAEIQLKMTPMRTLIKGQTHE